MADAIAEMVLGSVCLALAIWAKQYGPFIKAVCLVVGIVLIIFGLVDIIP